MPTPQRHPTDSGNDSRPEPTDRPRRRCVDRVPRRLGRGFDLDTVLDLVTEDLEYINVTLPTVHGRERLERLARPLMRPDRFGFNAYLNHVATEGERGADRPGRQLTFRRFARRFWVYGRFEVHDGKIAVWRTRSTGSTSRSATCEGCRAVRPALEPALPAR